jgi:hypothetical protein
VEVPQLDLSALRRRLAMTQWPKKGEGIDEDLGSVDARGVEAAADWDSLWFPETTSGMSEVRTSRLR